jgi:hypothetical protein
MDASLRVIFLAGNSTPQDFEAPMPKFKSSFLITVDHDKPIKDLGDLIAARAYTMDGVATDSGGVTVRTVNDRAAGLFNRTLDMIGFGAAMGEL